MMLMLLVLSILNESQKHEDSTWQRKKKKETKRKKTSDGSSTDLKLTPFEDSDERRHARTSATVCPRRASLTTGFPSMTQSNRLFASSKATTRDSAHPGNQPKAAFLLTVGEEVNLPTGYSHELCWFSKSTEWSANGPVLE